MVTMSADTNIPNSISKRKNPSENQLLAANSYTFSSLKVFVKVVWYLWISQQNLFKTPFSSSWISRCKSFIHSSTWFGHWPYLWIDFNNIHCICFVQQRTILHIFDPHIIWATPKFLDNFWNAHIKYKLVNYRNSFSFKRKVWWCNFWYQYNPIRINFIRIVGKFICLKQYKWNVNGKPTTIAWFSMYFATILWTKIVWLN